MKTSVFLKSAAAVLAAGWVSAQAGNIALG
ncbi:MAG: hypothetical protein RJA17_1213, partial [Pseudomonadota bacterium]